MYYSSHSNEPGEKGEQGRIGEKTKSNIF